ncbi:MAG: DUF2225 domain-containing protein [Lachnospiraceae bacterium]|nr:DUF2225 domain-containing protein [Lachnospiraceae bacterium]
MAGILDGLGQFGLGNLEGASIFEQPKKEATGEGAEAPVEKEEDFLFDKTFECPVCSNKFTARTVRAGKVKLVGTDLDLRPKYQQADVLKYDVVCCNRCGYTALSRYFPHVTDKQAKMVKEQISINFKPLQQSTDVYSYDEALDRHKLALVTSIVTKAQASERAYICLKSAWLLRGKRENLDPATPDFAKVTAELQDQENQFLVNALEGFKSAIQTEGFPMAGMDDTTVSYLIAALATECHQTDVASKMIAQILTSPSANARIKDKARDLKDVLMQELKKNAK